MDASRTPAIPQQVSTQMAKIVEVFFHLFTPIKNMFADLHCSFHAFCPVRLYVIGVIMSASVSEVYRLPRQRCYTHSVCKPFMILDSPHLDCPRELMRLKNYLTNIFRIMLCTVFSD